MRYTPGASSFIGYGMRVRVKHEGSFYDGDIGIVSGYGRWGYLVIEIIKNGHTYTPEIKRGYLVPVPPGSEAGA